MKKLLLLSLIIFSLYSCKSEKTSIIINTKGKLSTKELLDAWSNAYKALNDSNYNDYLTHAEKVYSYAPNDFSLKILYADGLMSANQSEKAVEVLESLINLHSHLSNDRLKQDQYQFIKKMDNFENYLSITEKDTKPINNSTIAYVLDEKDLIPEGIAYDKQTQTIYLSSVNKRKIVAINQEGIVQDFIKSGQDDILAVLGMEVDPERRHLWVCSEWENPRKIVADSLLFTSVYKYDIETKKLIKKYTLKDTVPRLLNDVAISSDGTVYVTESNEAKVYIIRPKKDSLELFINSDHGYYANGITISDDDKYLYFSHFFGGTLVVDLNKNTISKLKHPENISTGRVDGLAFYKNSLIMHQDEICRYYLNENGDSIIKKEVIERNNPLFNIPTTGEVTGDEYFYIANSQLGSFDAEGFVFPNEELDSVFILKTNLDF